MPFATDADLLRYEPQLFAAAYFPNQTRLTINDATVTGTTLTSASANFVNAGIDTGAVAWFEDEAWEVADRVDLGTLTVSALRPNPDDEPLSPGVSDAGLGVAFRSFQPQAAQAQIDLLLRLGIDPDDPNPQLATVDLLSTRQLARLETLATLALIFEALATNAEDPDPALAKATHYRDRCEHALRNANILAQLGGTDAPVTTLQFRHTQLRRTN